jgi:Fic family protein
MYNWQREYWSQFKFTSTNFESKLGAIMLKAGELKGKLAALPADVRIAVVVEILVLEAMKTSEIEGELFNKVEIISSIQQNLGLTVLKNPKDKNAIGLSKMLIQVRDEYAQELSELQLKQWHESLLGNQKNIHAGKYREQKAPMQIISGSIHKPKIHYDAPPSVQVPSEMERFILWFNEPTSTYLAPPIKAAVAHLYFESIYPFEDGNGRIGRAIAEKALSQGLNFPLPFSISIAIEKNRKAYFAALQKTEKSLEITEWIAWFFTMLVEAQTMADQMITWTIGKFHFYNRHDSILNERQSKVIHRMFEAGPDGFQGGMNVQKYIGITGTLKATATRDLQYLVEKNIFTSNLAGRSTHYELIYR